MRSFARILSGILVAPLIALTACAPEQGQGTVGRLTPDLATVPVDAARILPDKPLRLAHLWHAAQKETDPPDWALPLDSFEAISQTPALTPGPEGLRADPGVEGIVLKCPVNRRARPYNTLRVRLRAESGEYLSISWQGSLSDNDYPFQSVSTRLLADGRFHTYRLFFNMENNPYWRGEIGELHLSIGSAAGPAVFQEVAFERDPADDRVPRADLSGVTMPYLHGNPKAWEFTVPPEGAVFQGNCARLTHGDTNGMEFLVAVEAGPDLPPDVITREVVPAHARGWRHVEADLSAYAGRQIVLSLQCSEGEAGVWGDPAVVCPDPPAPPPPVVLISLDTVRRDHLSVYGYPHDTAPNLAAFAAEAVVFENAVVEEPWTLTSHITMLTGLSRHRHGVDRDRNLATSWNTLGERLRDAGYRTGGFTSNSPWMMPWRGFQQGLDHYHWPGDIETLFEGADTTADQACAWLETRRNGGFFLFLHLYEPHSKFQSMGYTLPYAPSDPGFVLRGLRETAPDYHRDLDPIPMATEFLVEANRGNLTVSPEELAHMIDLYDDSVTMTDHAVGRVFDLMKARGWYDHAVILVTADHGEAFGEQGFFLHDRLLECNVRVPLMIRLPGGRDGGRRVAKTVTNMDLMPTLLDMLGLPPEDGIDGRSVFPLDAATPRREAGTHHVCVIGNQTYHAFRTPEWKLIQSTRTSGYELYHLAADPAETEDLSMALPGQEAALRASLEEGHRDASNWHVAVHGGTGESRVTVMWTSPRRVRHIALTGHEPETDTTFTKPPGTRAGAVCTAGPGDTATLHALLPPEPARLTVDADGPFTLLAGGHPPESSGGETIDITVSPDDPLMMEEPPVPIDSETCVVRAWYTPTGYQEGSGQDLTDEGQALIESMGYFAG